MYEGSDREARRKQRAFCRQGRCGPSCHPAHLSINQQSILSLKALRPAHTFNPASTPPPISGSFPGDLRLDPPASTALQWCSAVAKRAHQSDVLRLPAHAPALSASTPTRAEPGAKSHVACGASKWNLCRYRLSRHIVHFHASIPFVRGVVARGGACRQWITRLGHTFALLAAACRSRQTHGTRAPGYAHGQQPTNKIPSPPREPKTLGEACAGRQAQGGEGALRHSLTYRAQPAIASCREQRKSLLRLPSLHTRTCRAVCIVWPLRLDRWQSTADPSCPCRLNRPGRRGSGQPRGMGATEGDEERGRVCCMRAWRVV